MKIEPEGILYIASGQRFVTEAEASARSVKSCMPGVKVALVSDQVSKEDCFDFQIPLENPQFSFVDKILALKKTPFKRTLFLDTDTFLLESVSDAFSLLDRFDIGAAVEPARYLYGIRGVPPSFPELNTGVILYNSCPAMVGLIDEWYRIYCEEIATMKAAGKQAWHDQLAFTEAIYKSRLAFFALPPEYNARILLPQQVSGLVRIVHSRLRNPEYHRTELAFINARADGARVLNPNPSRVLEYLRATWMLFRVLERS